MANSGQGRVIRESNLDRFLKNTIVSVKTLHVPQANVNESANDESYEPYFVLGDLWRSLEGLGVSGIGAPFVLNKDDIIEEIYIPSLSGLQLYVDPSTPVTTDRWSEDSFTAVYRDSDLCSKDIDVFGLESSKLENNVDDSIDPGLLAFEFFENVLPFTRSPLYDRAVEISLKFPEILTYRSCDLTPSSWFSLTWRPIAGIPLGPSLKELDTYFMTFHRLSTPLRGTNGNVSRVGAPRVSLPSFRYAVSRFKSSDWTEDAVDGFKQVTSMMQSTDNWLTRLNVKHPDFIYFKHHTFLH